MLLPCKQVSVWVTGVVHRRGLRGSLLPRLLLAGNRLLRTLAGASVGLGSLTTHGQPAAPPQALIAADLDLAADVGLDLTTEVTLDFIVVLDVVPQPDEVLVGQVLRT